MFIHVTALCCYVYGILKVCGGGVNIVPARFIAASLRQCYEVFGKTILYVQWDLYNLDTLGTKKSVLISLGSKPHKNGILGRKKRPLYRGCPDFRES